MSAIDSAKNTANNIWRGVWTSVSGPPTESKFFEKGWLTPQEFVASGDKLI